MMKDSSAGEAQRPVLLYDGGCGFCNTWVQRLKRWDRRGRGVYIPMASDLGKALMRKAGMDPWSRPDSLMLLHGDRIYIYSEAVRVYLSFLGGGWALAALWLKGIPRPWRDGIYRYFARHRYHWFGAAESGDFCQIPPHSPGSGKNMGN